MGLQRSLERPRSSFDLAPNRQGFGGGGGKDSGGRSEQNLRGKGQFVWWRDLSEGGQKLYNILIGEGGDREFLPLDAEEEGFNLTAALGELREWGFLDESDPRRVKLKRRRSE